MKALFLAYWSACAIAANVSSNTGVMILAHGGSAKWNKEVLNLRDAIKKHGYPVEAAFGMADIESMKKALEKLENHPIDRVVCVALLVSSFSELYDQFAYVLGLRDKPSETLIAALRAGQHHNKSGPGHQHRHTADTRRLQTKLKLHLTPALDDHDYAAQILLERAKKISRQPKEEAVFLVSHGPYTDEADKEWSAMADRLAKKVASRGGFAEVLAFNLRDDSPRNIKEAKEKALREAMRQQAQQKRKVLVLAHVIAFNGIESHIRKATSGIFHKISREALLPHPLMERWVLEQIKNAEKK